MTATTSEKQRRLTVGRTVADARRDLGLTVTDLAERTRIRPHIIRDIERDDYASCRGSFYARGHVKALAAVLGLDAEPLLAQLDDAQPSPVPALRAAPLADWSPGEPARRAASPGGAGSRLAGRRVPGPRVSAPRLSAPRLTEPGRSMRQSGDDSAGGPRWLTGVLVVVGLAVLLVVISVVIGLTRDDPGSGSGGGSTSAVGTAPSRAAATSSHPASTRPTVVALQLTAVGAPTWVSVHNAAGRELFVGILHTGVPVHFTASKSLSVRYGNTSTVDVSLAHRSIGHPHCSGHGVCTVTYPVGGSPRPSTG